MNATTHDTVDAALSDAELALMVRDAEGLRLVSYRLQTLLDATQDVGDAGWLLAALRTVDEARQTLS